MLITNPSLVETGLDLNDFTTLYYYNIAYNLFTLRQSSRRSWRINQKAPRIEVYFSYYEGTMQNRAIKLMASKLAAAGMIEGNFTEEGLAAMSDCTDMTTALARELTQGIKNEVEDLSAVFKKMAILKPTTEQMTLETILSETKNITTTPKFIIDEVENITITPVVSTYQTPIPIIDDTSEMTIYSTNAPFTASALLAFVNNTKPVKAVTTNKAENDLYNIFEILAA